MSLLPALLPRSRPESLVGGRGLDRLVGLQRAAQDVDVETAEHLLRPRAVERHQHDAVALFLLAAHFGREAEHAREREDTGARRHLVHDLLTISSDVIRRARDWLARLAAGGHRWRQQRIVPESIDDN